MYGSKKLVSSMALLFLTAQDLVGETQGLFWGNNEEDSGLIELDAHVTNRNPDYINGLGSHLMNLVEEDASDDQKDYIETKLKNLFNIQIFSRVYFGSNKQGFDLVFDSGSSWVWVEHDFCGNCANPNKFNSRESTTFD